MSHCTDQKGITRMVNELDLELNSQGDCMEEEEGGGGGEEEEEEGGWAVSWHAGSIPFPHFTRPPLSQP